MCKLDFSKAFMYEFLYNNKYGNNSRLLFIDTEILMYEIKTEDFYEDFSKGKNMLNFSNVQLNESFMMIETNWGLVKSKIKQLVLQLRIC